MVYASTTKFLNPFAAPYQARQEKYLDKRSKQGPQLVVVGCASPLQAQPSCAGVMLFCGCQSGFYRYLIIPRPSTLSFDA
jgi:hypothetical protein